MPWQTILKEKKIAETEFTEKIQPFLFTECFALDLEDCQKHGVPELTNPKHMEGATRKTLDACNVYGPLLEMQECRTAKGTTATFLLVNVLSLLSGLCQQGGTYYKLLKMYANSTSTPLQMALYSDEVIPGNQLAAKTERKSWCIYMTCANFPAHILSVEDAWLSICILRSSFVNELEGSISQIFKIVFHKLFHGTKDLRQGVWMPGPAPADGFRLSFSPTMIVQDGAAHKFLWCIKGDAGEKCCFLCGNIRSMYGAEDKIPLHSHADSYLTTDEEIWSSMARLKTKKTELRGKAWANWQQATGYTYSAEALLCDDSLSDVVRPVSMYLHDWMHCTLNSGTLTVTCWLLLTALEAAGLKIWATLESFVKLWTLPKVLAGIKLENLFIQKRVASCKKAGAFKCTASELLTFHAIFAYYVRTCVARHFLQDECEVFLTMSLLVDMLQAASQGHAGVQPEALTAIADSVMRLMFKANWSQY